MFKKPINKIFNSSVFFRFVVTLVEILISKKILKKEVSKRGIEIGYWVFERIWSIEKTKIRNT